jgi:3-hydroxybutyryl-CoA dehydrogenase
MNATGLDRGTIAVIGAGRMGSGIALAMAYAAYPVALVDSEARPRDEFDTLAGSVLSSIAEEVDFLREAGLLTGAQASALVKRVQVLPRDDESGVLQGASLVFEAVLEVLDVKQSTYQWLCGKIPQDAVIASTTSTMLSDELARFVTNPARFLNAHWLNPAYLMPLVEISPSTSTDEKVVTDLKAFLECIGKVPVVCAASPGYILSRVQAVALNEAARIAEEGIASVEDIDKAMQTGFGIRYANMGLLEFIDWGGGDILYHATRYLGRTLDAQRFTSPDVVREHMENNKNGLRDGQGFYDYRGVDVDAYRKQRLTSLVKLLQHLSLVPAPGGEE